jgi:hypothetical protein
MGRGGNCNCWQSCLLIGVKKPMPAWILCTRLCSCQDEGILEERGASVLVSGGNSLVVGTEFDVIHPL